MIRSSKYFTKCLSLINLRLSCSSWFLFSLTFKSKELNIGTLFSVPSAGPSNITAQNTSSSSIIVTWDGVLQEHRNGNITGYKVYIKKVGSEGGWESEETKQKIFAKSELDLWSFYYIKISAKTSVGEGPQSNVVRVRTAEDGEFSA